jgi:Uncharacterised nucleotidyltransferase
MLEPRSENHASISFRQNLALLSLLLKGNHDAAAERLRNGVVEPAEFVQFLDRHALQLFVFSLLCGSPARKWLPPKSLDDLKIYSLQQWARQERLVRELFRLSSLLKAAGHEFILLKGPYLAERFFGGIDRRAFSDLDILIKREDLAAVERLLCSSGYTQKSSSFLSRSLTTRFAYAYDFVKANVAVDLHWQFSAQPTHGLDYEAIWREKQPFTLRRHRFHVLSDEYEVVFKLISIFTDLEMGMARLRPFVDLHFIVQKVSHRFDWEAFLEHRKRERTRRLSLTVLALFLGLFDCGDDFKEMAALVARDRKMLKVVPAKYYRPLMEAVPGAAWNKIWASGVYERSRFTVFLWWIVSFPFRIAVDQPEKYARMKRKLSWLGLRGPKSDALVEPAEIRRPTQ